MFVGLAALCVGRCQRVRRGCARSPCNAHRSTSLITICRRVPADQSRPFFTRSHAVFPERAVTRRTSSTSLSPQTVTFGLSPTPIVVESGNSLFLPLIFLDHCFGLVPASGSFASSAFPVPPLTRWVPPIKQPLTLEAEAIRLWMAPRKWGKKKEKIQSWLALTQ
jgi:hypothetical protein